MAIPPLSLLVFDFFPDGYDVYDIVYASSDTDSGKEYGESSDEDYGSLDEAGKRLTELLNEDEGSSSVSSIGPYMSSPGSKDENAGNSRNRRKRKRSRKKPSRKKPSMSQSAQLNPSLKSITKEKMRKTKKERLVSPNNKTEVLRSLKRKRSSSEGEYVLKKQPKLMSENSEANSSKNFEEDRPTLEDISEGMVHDQLSPMEVKSGEKDNLTSYEDSAAIFVENISDKAANNFSLKEKPEMLQSNQLSSEEATEKSQGQLSDNDSDKYSSEKSIETDHYSHKDSSEDNSGTLADDESDHEEEKTNFRNDAYVRNYRKISSIASEEHAGNYAISEKAGASSTKQTSKNASNVPLRRNLKEELYKEKCKDDPEYPSKVTDLRKSLHETIPKVHEKKGKSSDKPPSRKASPEEKSYENPGPSTKDDGMERNSNRDSSKISKKEKDIEDKKYIKLCKWISKHIDKNYNPKKGSQKKDSPKKGSPKEGSPKKNSPKEGSPKKNSPKKDSPKKGSPRKILTRWEKKTCRRNKIFKLFSKYHNLQNRRAMEMEEEENESSEEVDSLLDISYDEEVEIIEEKNESFEQVVNLSDVQIDGYYIDNFEFSNIVGAEEFIGNEEEVVHEDNDQSLDIKPFENQSSNSQASENQSRISLSDNNSNSLWNFGETFRQPFAYISYRQQSVDQSLVLQQSALRLLRARRLAYFGLFIITGLLCFQLSAIQRMVRQQPANRATGGQQAANQAPGGQQPANLAPGGQQPANLAPGGQQPANLAPGGQQPANLAPGGQQPANLAPGGQQPANLAPGGQQPANRAPGGQQTAHRAPDGQHPSDGPHRGQ